MTHLVWAVIVLIAAYSAFHIGRRWEVGRREEELDHLEEERYRRGGRQGTVRLKTMKIRR